MWKYHKTLSPRKLFKNFHLFLFMVISFDSKAVRPLKLDLNIQSRCGSVKVANRVIYSQVIVPNGLMRAGRSSRGSECENKAKSRGRQGGGRK